MSEQNWPPEPWYRYMQQWKCGDGIAYHCYIKDKNDMIITPWPKEGNVTVDRIIACVNTCAGTPTEDLQTILNLGRDLLRYLKDKHIEDMLNLVNQETIDKLTEDDDA